MKTTHALLLVAAAVGVLYILHMMMSHQGQQILPGVGLG
jgi:hypothetical protein